ncbi:MAG: hypothetical protein GMKNLPBB_02348 [Myxococcota bacterium]|nr:hypothetical protein [Myxococcota bacterium]
MLKTTKFAAELFAIAAVLAIAACSSDSKTDAGTTSDGSATRTDASVPADGGGAADTGGGSDAAPPADGGGGGDTEPPPPVDGCKSDGDCQAGETCTLSVCLGKADADLKREDGQPVDLACNENKPAKPAGPDKADAEGCINVFGLDANTDGVTLEIRKYEAGKNWDDLEKITTVTATLDADDKCGNKGKYAVKGVPTNTLLVFETKGAGFVTTRQFNMYFPADKAADLKLNNEWTDANIIAESTYKLIPIVAGVPSGVKKGNGAVAGTIRDCAFNRLENAIVGMTKRPTKLTYFNGNTDSPQPDPTRSASNKDSTYAAIDIGAGQMKVVAGGNSGGKWMKAGELNIEGIADGVVILSFGRPRP